MQRFVFCINDIPWSVNPFSIYGFPSVSSAVAILFYLNHQKQKELLGASQAMGKMAHMAGMSEIASEVIHNIGNVMTVVFAYFSTIDSVFRKSQYKVIANAKKMMEEKRDSVAQIKDSDPQLYKLIQFYAEFGNQTYDEYELIKKNVDELNQRMYLIKDILKTQQSYINAGAFMEDCSIEELIDVTHKIMAEKIKNRGIKVEKNYQNTPPLSLQRSKLLNVFTNLVKNAVEAMEGSEVRKLKFETAKIGKTLKVAISDTGEGIEEEKFKSIFSYGYSTKKTGTGLGLHSCANLIKTMGGSIDVRSNGIGHGATFLITLPCE